MTLPNSLLTGAESKDPENASAVNAASGSSLDNVRATMPAHAV